MEFKKNLVKYIKSQYEQEVRYKQILDQAQEYIERYFENLKDELNEIMLVTTDISISVRHIANKVEVVSFKIDDHQLYFERSEKSIDIFIQKGKEKLKFYAKIIPEYKDGHYSGQCIDSIGSILDGNIDNFMSHYLKLAFEDLIMDKAI